MDDRTYVQFAQPGDGTRFSDIVPTPRNPNDPRIRVNIDLSDVETGFVDHYAVYRNAVALEQGEPLHVKWKRKSITESLISNQIAQERKDLAKMFKAIGPWPETEAEMREYAKRAIAWRSKQGK